MASKTRLVNSSLMQSYFLYSALLALKLMALAPLAGLICNPVNARRTNVSDLKHLTPFWLVAALYTTTSPDETTAVFLFRMFVIARFVSAAGHVVKIPRILNDAAFLVSFGVTAYMGLKVVYEYRKAI